MMELIKSFDIKYFAKFVGFIMIFYFFNLFYVGLTTPGGSTYSHFCNQYLNYIDSTIKLVLRIAQFFSLAFGVEAGVTGSLLKVNRGASVYMAFACIGLGTLSFWAAFIFAHQDKWKRKILWAIGGFAAILIINGLRVCLVLIAMQKKWATPPYIDHHDMFNLASYSAIILLIYIYSKRSDKDKEEKGGDLNNLYPSFN